jgi:GntR family histidine utilization transcriptional repressor
MSRGSFAHVKQAVIRRIQDGEWPQGSLLPTELELAAEFGCARATVNRALRELAEEGVVERKRKSGTRVAVMPAKRAILPISIVRQTVEEMNAAYRYALVSRNQIEAPAWLASRLGLGHGRQVLHVECMHYADNQPFQFEERWVNIAAVPDIVEADLETTGPNEWLLREVPFTDAQISFGAIAADERLAGFLAAPEGTPLLQMERTTWLREQPVTLVRMAFHPGYRMTTHY